MEQAIYALEICPDDKNDTENSIVAEEMEDDALWIEDLENEDIEA